MGLRVTGIESVMAMLENDAERAGRGARDALERGAKKIQKRARDYAPVDLGNLESAIQIKPEFGAGGRKAFVVYVDEEHEAKGNRIVGDYYVRMHEGTYNLGPDSEAKADRLGVVVGPKYLERAFIELEPEIREDVERNVDIGIGH